MLAQSAKRESAQTKTEVTQCHIEIARDGQKIANDQKQPSSDDVSKDARLKSYANPGDDFDHADEEHQLMPMTAHQIVHHGRKILIPIDEEMQEFVRASNDGRDSKAKTQDGKSLPVEAIGR
jgi:hypothetical protein